LLVSDAILFTVFTPTYNRAHTLHRVYHSLCAQTLRDLEWIVVDDGSTDNTAKLVADWAKTADFPIRYFKQEHCGKHIAHNLAVRKARGLFFLIFDSDDSCVPHALERMLYHWNSIPERDRSLFSGVTGLCADQYGRIVGDRFPFVPFDYSLRERMFIYGLRGEKWGAVLTEIARRFPFPEIRGTSFVPEGVVWFQIANIYKSRGINEVFRTYYVDDLKTGTTLSRTKDLSSSATGRSYYYVWLLNNELEYFFHSPFPFLKAGLMLPVVTWISRQSYRSVLNSLKYRLAKTLVLLALPFALLLFAAIKIKTLVSSQKAAATTSLGLW
jgi:glycosyltransferase involved in cell wall biosynthesis